MIETTREENIRQLGSILEDIPVLMLTTIQREDGSLHSQPMIVQKTPFDGTLWFFSTLESAKVEEIRAGSAANLTFSDPDQGRYLSISGMAYVVPDRVKMESLWSDIYQGWFPRGLEQPDLVLLRMDVNEATIWDADRGEKSLWLEF